MCAFPHLAVEVTTDSLLGPGLLVKLRPPLLLRVPHHVRHQLQSESTISQSDLGGIMVMCVYAQTPVCMHVAVIGIRLTFRSLL